MVAPFEAVPVGFVHSTVERPRDMPIQGVPASVEVLPEYASALSGIEENSHIVVLCHIHEADRDVLVARPRKLGDGFPERGVFAMRSPARPNPVSLCVTRLVGREGNVLHVDPLDMVEGTPVIDIKPYSFGWDCIFSARSRRPLIDARIAPESVMEDCLRVAANFHGSSCPGIVIGVRETLAALRKLDILDPRGSKRLVVFTESDRCLVDAIMALTGCTPGRRTIRLVETGKMAATFLDTETGRAVRVAPRELPSLGDVSTREGRDEVSRRLKAMDEDELLSLTEVRVDLAEEDQPGMPRFSARCDECGDRVRDRREVIVDGRTLCRHCSGQGYYSVVEG